MRIRVCVAEFESGALVLALVGLLHGAALGFQVERL